MRKPTKCRSCNINYELTGLTGRHEIIKADKACPLCGVSEKIVLHYGHEGLSGEAIECHSCHNYIRYTNGTPEAIWKDEIYLSPNYLLLRSYEDNTSTYFQNNKIIFETNNIIQFTSLDNLIEKLKTIVVFS